MTAHKTFSSNVPMSKSLGWNSSTFNVGKELYPLFLTGENLLEPFIGGVNVVATFIYCACRSALAERSLTQTSLLPTINLPIALCLDTVVRVAHSGTTEARSSFSPSAVAPL